MLTTSKHPSESVKPENQAFEPRGVVSKVPEVKEWDLIENLVSLPD